MTTSAKPMFGGIPLTPQFVANLISQHEEHALEDPQIPGVLVFEKHLFLMQTFQWDLAQHAMTTAVIEALRLAVFNCPEANPHGWAYARHLGRAYYEYGITAVPMQILYLLQYLRSWTGDEARAAKKILRKWCTEKRTVK